MNKQNFYQVSKYDFVLAGIILIFSFTPFLYFKNISSHNGKKALIYKNSRLIEEVNLSQEKTINLDNMKIETKEGCIRILKSDCPRGICKHIGWVSNPAQTIVCVPNKIFIEIVGNSKNIEYNAITY